MREELGEEGAMLSNLCNLCTIFYLVPLPFIYLCHWMRLQLDLCSLEEHKHFWSRSSPLAPPFTVLPLPYDFTICFYTHDGKFCRKSKLSTIPVSHDNIV